MLWRRYNQKEEKLIKLLKRNKLDIRIEEILIKAIDFNKNNLVRYIIDNYNIDYNYKNEIDYDLISVAVISGNIEIINLLKNKGINLEKKYKYNNKSNTIISNLFLFNNLINFSSFFVLISSAIFIIL